MIPGPVIRWAGGKTKLLPELLSRMPERYGRYFEPFAGGAALFFRVAPARGAVLNDRNADLVAMYRAIRSDTEPLLRELRSHRRKHSKEHYYAVRERFNRTRDHALNDVAYAKRAAAFIYLNRTNFNGLWRVNSSGEFNVPMGRVTNPNIYDPDAIFAARHLLADDVMIRNQSYETALYDVKRGDFVYFDPPYDPLTPTSNFTSYTAGAFGRDQQRELADLAARLVARGCQVMLSNSNTRFVRSLYPASKGFRIDRVMCPRAINSNASKRAAVAEVIITGGYEIPRWSRARAG